MARSLRRGPQGEYPLRPLGTVMLVMGGIVTLGIICILVWGHVI